MRRVVLAPSVEREMFAHAASAQSWTLQRVADADKHESYVETWAAETSQSAAHYMEDDLLRLSYVVVTGDETSDAVEELVRELDTVSAREALGQLESSATPDERADALAYLAVAADPERPDEAVVDAIGRALADVDPGVRRVAVAGCAYLDWPMLDSLLASAAATDPDADVRRFADQVLEVIRRQRRGGGA